MRQLYHKVNSFKGGYRRQEIFLKNDDGRLVTNQEEIMERWAEYFEKLLNCEEPVKIHLHMDTTNPMMISAQLHQRRKSNNKSKDSKTTSHSEKMTSKGKY